MVHFLLQNPIHFVLHFLPDTTRNTPILKEIACFKTRKNAIFYKVLAINQNFVSGKRTLERSNVPMRLYQVSQITYKYNRNP